MDRILWGWSKSIESSVVEIENKMYVRYFEKIFKKKFFSFRQKEKKNIKIKKKITQKLIYVF